MAEPDPPAISFEEATARLTAPGAPFEIVECEIAGRMLRVWKNAPPTLREAFQLGRAHGDKTFLVHGEERVTFEGFARAALTIARRLREMGIVKGDRVAIAMRNLPEWAAIFFGASLAGAIATPLNAWWTGRELEYGLIDSGARVLFVDGERLERVLEHLPNCPAISGVVVARANEAIARPSVARLEDWIGEAADWPKLAPLAFPDVDLKPEDDATIFYTSGTTGHPKGALGTHRNSCTTILARPYSLARSRLRRGEPLVKPDPAAPQKSTLVTVPLFHVTGCQSHLIPALVAGTKLVLMRKWDADLALELIERERINAVVGVPTVAWQLIEHPDAARRDLSSLEGVSYGGAPAAAELVRRIRHVLPRAAAGTAWGMTETSAAFTAVSGEDYERRPASCGPALPVGDIRVVDANGEDVAVGTSGELWVSGPNVIKGYWRNPRATAESFVEGWLRTGDIGFLDADGFCTIVDRAKDMLIRGGENIYCAEVENVLFEHPGIVDAAVVGLPHRTLGEEPAAIVTVKAGAKTSEADLRAFVAERLAAFKVPVRIVMRDAFLPRNANGKILKGELRKLFAPPAG